MQSIKEKNLLFFVANRGKLEFHIKIVLETTGVVDDDGMRLGQYLDALGDLCRPT